jgi:hypothetical protein
MSGVADLPLHYGHVPPWIYGIMKRMARAIVKLVVQEMGTTKLLERLSNPLWFQALNNTIGMDWDSSGSTTVTTAVLKEILREENLGVLAVGGKGRYSKYVPKELEELAELGIIDYGKTRELATVSKLTAKADSALLQDGFTLYHHVVFFDESGRWVVIQQGMNLSERLARRYHLAWTKTEPHDITLEPHSGVLCERTTVPLNLTARESVESREVIVDVVKEGVAKISKYVALVNAAIKGYKPLVGDLPRPILRDLPYYKPVNLTQNLLSVLKEAYEVSPSNFQELILRTRVGPETLRALALISELIYREPPPLRDVEVYSPFKYSFTIGGKDGIPYPIKRELAEEVIRELYEILRAAELGERDKVRAFRNLSKIAPPDILPL